MVDSGDAFWQESYDRAYKLYADKQIPTTEEWARSTPCNCSSDLAARFPDVPWFDNGSGHMDGCPKHILWLNYGCAVGTGFWSSTDPERRLDLLYGKATPKYIVRIRPTPWWRIDLRLRDWMDEWAEKMAGRGL